MKIKKVKEECTVVPDVAKIARRMTGETQIMIIINSFWDLNWKSKLMLVKNNLVYGLELLKMNYATGIKLLCELEILKLKNIEEKTICLHGQMVDMAVALKNYNVIKYFFNISTLYGFKPALQTNNYYFLIKLLANVKDIPRNLTIYTNDKINDSFTPKAFFKKKRYG